MKFRAGGSSAFYNKPLAMLQGKTIHAGEVFGPAVEALATILSGDGTEEEKRVAANKYFLPFHPERNTEAAHAATAVDLILNDPEVSSVAILSGTLGRSERSLQRLFREHVGISPKWVIQRYRLHELVERLNTVQQINWADTAATLGYFDPSHLIRDFKKRTGYSPKRYRRSTESGSS